MVSSALLWTALAGAAYGEGLVKELLRVETRGGRVLRFPGMADLTREGVPWESNGSFEMAHEKEYQGLGCYRLVMRDSDMYPMMAGTGLTLQPNRSYVISVLLSCDFARPTEVNVGLWHVDANGRTFLMNLNGIPNQTDGWQHWEWEFASDPRCGEGTESRFYFQPWGFAPAGQVRIADVALIELPPRPLIPYPPGKGVTFRGGPGELPMRIEDVQTSADMVVVRTTGAVYRFDTRGSVIEQWQTIEHARPVARWYVSVPIERLEVVEQNRRECVLANDHVTFGIQCDSMVMVSPQRDLTLICESLIGGRWNRLFHGHLLVIDDEGGFAANPDIPLGSGRLARTEVVTPGLDFPGVAGDTGFLSDAPPGWKVSWAISPGERLAISTFPPRPFDWQRSFAMNWALTFRGLDSSKYREWGKYLNVVVLWDFCQRSWGMSFGRHYVPYDENTYREHIAEVGRQGMVPVSYMSAYFYYSRDPEEYVGEVRRHRDLYGIEGVYSDGVPSQEWLVAYEEVRMLREIFPRGIIILHTTGQPGNGGPPLALPDIFMPFIDTYATATYRGEWVPYSQGAGWPYPKCVTSQYRKANCIGIQKGDRWTLPQIEQDLVDLYYNGRADHWPGVEVPKEWRDRYYPVLQELRQTWEVHGGEDCFLERHYLPKLQELIGDMGHLK
jgi:hypothetical protein